MNILDDKNLKEIIYSILFVAGDGIEKSFIAEKLDISKKDLDKALDDLKKELSGDKGIHLIEYKDKVQLATNPNYASYISDVLNPIREKSLTRAALETLAIIAYKQPITKLEIEDIRGVNSDYAVQILIDQNMIEVVGRKDAVGKPLLFGTTENFLKRFDIKNVSDLPDYDELLERIKTIRTEEEENSQDTLFRNVDDLEFNEELPDYLKGENFQRIEADGNEDKSSERDKAYLEEKPNKTSKNKKEEQIEVKTIEVEVEEGSLENNKDSTENNKETSSSSEELNDIDLSKLALLADSDLDDDIIIGSVDVNKLKNS